MNASPSRITSALLKANIKQYMTQWQYKLLLIKLLFGGISESKAQYSDK